MDGDLKKGLRTLYLDLAKKFHPDKFSEDTRENAEQIMQRLNEYYGNNDLQGMLEIQKDVGIDMFNDLRESVQEKIKRADTLLAQLHTTRDQIASDIEELESSQMNKMKLRMDAGWKQGKDVIADLADELQDEIAAVEQKLTSLKEKLSGLA